MVNRKPSQTVPRQKQLIDRLSRFMWLNRHFNYPSFVLSLATKIVVNQLVFAPTFNTYFFSMQSLLSGASVAEAWERIKNTVPRSFINSWKLWPAVTAFSFTFISPQYRFLFAGEALSLSPLFDARRAARAGCAKICTNTRCRRLCCWLAILSELAESKSGGGREGFGGKREYCTHGRLKESMSRRSRAE